LAIPVVQVMTATAAAALPKLSGLEPLPLWDFVAAEQDHLQLYHFDSFCWMFWVIVKGFSF